MTETQVLQTLLAVGVSLFMLFMIRFWLTGH
jgi:hypothetical protein